ncbi:MaoC family dehydratase N-terminal domain-containing protein [Arthrobacter rhombi]|uniref:FAS1-like dehydratase domain-containing protein n=1 Tax=Arthrobacter rhombi TaxID=71253 RepID=UPI0031D28D9E
MDGTTLVGTVVDEVAFDVERGKIAEFAHATGVDDPIHTDRREAQRRQLPDVAATATHVVVAGHHRSQSAMLDTLGLELARVVVGKTGWEYIRPLVAGDSLTGQRVVTGDEAKTSSNGSPLRIITLHTDYRDRGGNVVVRQQETIIERGRK